MNKYIYSNIIIIGIDVIDNKMTYHIVGTVPKSNSKIVEIGKIDTSKI